MMKKSSCFILFLCGLMVFSLLLLGACGSTPAPANQTPASPAGSAAEPAPGAAAGQDLAADTAPLNVTFAGSSPGGVWYMVMGGVTETINKSFPQSSVTVVPGDGVSNLIRVANGEAEIGMSHSAIAAAAVMGGDPFEEVYENVATVAALYPSHLQFVVTEKSGITSIRQIMENQMKARLSVDAPGSTGELAFKRMINEYGFTYEDIERWGGQVVYKNMGDSSDMLSDGLLDGMSTMTLYPASPITEAAVNNKLIMMDIEPAIAAALSEKYGYGVSTIPGGTYQFQPEDVTSASSYTVICVPKFSDDEVAYKVAKSIAENLAYLKSVHVAMEDLTPLGLTENLGAPLHPGAERYYREQGIL